MTQDSDPAWVHSYAAAIAFAAIAGAVDAIGFLNFHTLYVSFMSGNTTRLAIALAKGDAGLALRGSAIIASFLAGVVAGDLLAGAPPRHPRPTLLVEAALLLTAALVCPGIGSSLLLAVAMGIHNALVLGAGGIRVALTYVTGTLVHIGRAVAARLAARASPPTLLPYIGLWAALCAGATAGAAGSVVGERPALIAAAALLAMTATVIDFARNPERDEQRAITTVRLSRAALQEGTE